VSEPTRRCDYMLPTCSHLNPDGECFTCELEMGHKGDHLSNCSMGKRVVWRRDEACGCITFDRDCECIVWSPLKERTK
jgi:hypothetical protein